MQTPQMLPGPFAREELLTQRAHIRSLTEEQAAGQRVWVEDDQEIRTEKRLCECDLAPKRVFASGVVSGLIAQRSAR